MERSSGMRSSSSLMSACLSWRVLAVLTILTALLPLTIQQQRDASNPELFKAELFLNTNELTSGLYEGEVRGRKLFGESQVPHGVGTMYYFTTDKFHRLNYTGEWRNGTRSGNGTTHFKDGAVYSGEYKKGLEHGSGFIRYPNGNTLDAEFVAGKIHGHGVFRYNNGDQREGFFRDNILDGQVIFTRINGETVIETWVNGKKVEDANNQGNDISNDPPRQIEDDPRPKIGELSRKLIEAAKRARTTTRRPVINLNGGNLTNGVNLEKLREAIFRHVNNRR